ncbi:heavy metal translocating P-type ATPase [Paenibacillus sp. GCM10023252]|uniref:heavy metal translocating P-type ATPase n=1 Tax=Paenibacillus sp. GCM10023252 TaxID=3252649 RepID=UPI00360CAB82
MKEYRIQGLSCGHCALKIEDQLKRLEYGQDTKLSYASAKLTLDPRVNLAKVEQILHSDGASLIPPAPEAKTDGHGHSHGHEHGHPHEHSHAHGHEHEHGHQHAGNRRTIQLLLLSVVLYAAALIGEGTLSEPATILLYLSATAISGYTTFIRGLRNLVKLSFNMDTLMTIALIGAVAIGEWKEATLVALLFGVNELLEGYGMERARRSMESLLKVAPREALRVINGREEVVPIASLSSGDLVKVKPGEQIPSDGYVVEGRSSVNEAAITGESLPAEKAAGETVLGGSLNNEGVLLVHITKAYKDSSLARILHLVEEAQETKTRTELFIHSFAKVYTPIIMIVAALVTLIPPLLLGQEWMTWVYQGLSVLIVGCPCALILSSPIAIVSGITRSARNGILVKGGVFLEQLGAIDILAFDKTGTLTKGEPHVVRTEVWDDERFLKVAGALESTSSHPLAGAIVKHVNQLGASYPKAVDIRSVAGSGMHGIVEGKPYWLGNEHSLQHLSIPQEQQAKIDAYKEQGLTIVLVADDIHILGMFGIADEIREESRDVIAALHRLGIKETVMVTGDHAKTAERVAAAVGVTRHYSGLLPEDKVAVIQQLSKRGRVAMIGDGMNDTPALAAAELGIAMGKGTDSAMETADIVLMQDHLGKLPEAISTARLVNRIIRFNIGVSLGLKVIALLLTIPGWLTLWIAILSDMGATVFVTLISLTILMDGSRLKRPKHL